MIEVSYGYLWNFERFLFGGDVGNLNLKSSVFYSTFKTSLVFLTCVLDYYESRSIMTDARSVNQNNYFGVLNLHNRQP